VHVPDGGRIGYEKVCKTEERAVPEDEISKAFEVDDGEIVLLEDGDFDAAAVEGAHTIDVQDFVPLEEIDPIFFERTYYLGPGRGGDKVYALLVKAMEQSGLVGVATYVMRERENLGCLRVRDGVLTLDKMYFADEIRPLDGLAPSGQRVGKRELEMALELVEGFRGHWDPSRYRDTYRDALLEVIERKRRGESPKRFAEEKEEAPPDLLEALRASVERAKQSSRTRTTRRARQRRTAAGRGRRTPKKARS
jgi:DNA end-binding protein Ku